MFKIDLNEIKNEVINIKQFVFQSQQNWQKSQ